LVSEGVRKMKCGRAKNEKKECRARENEIKLDDDDDDDMGG